MTGDAFIPVRVGERWAVGAMTDRRARTVAWVIGDEGNADEVARLMSAAVTAVDASEPFG
jgi:hypothetical protein